MIVFGAVALGAWSSWPKTIVISPSDFTFSENGWWNTTTIALTNASDKPKYSVWVEIWSDDPKVDPMKDIKWSVDDNPDAIKLGVGASAVLNTDVIGLLTTEPHRAILLRFYEVVPGRTRHTVVTGMMKTKSNGKAQIRGFKDEPEPLIGR